MWSFNDIANMPCTNSVYIKSSMLLNTVSFHVYEYSNIIIIYLKL